MPARGGDLQRASRAREPTHVGEIHGLVVEVGLGALRGAGRRRLRPFGFALQACAQLRDRARRAHLHAVHERRLGDVGRGHDHRARPGGAERVDEREDAGHRADRSVEPQLAEHADLVEHSVRELARGGDETEADRELESRAGLANPARREVDRDPLLRELEVRRQQCGADALARLADRGVRQPDDVIAGEARRDVDLDGHDVTVDARERGAANRGEHGGPPEKRGGGGP